MQCKPCNLFLYPWNSWWIDSCHGQDFQDLQGQWWAFAPLAMHPLLKSSHIGVIDIPVFNTMTHLVARISNHVVFGIEMRHNEWFLHAVVQFAEATPFIAPFVSWSPYILQPWVSHYLFLRFVQIRIFQVGLFHSVKHSGREKSLAHIYHTIFRYLSEGEETHRWEAGITISLLNFRIWSVNSWSRVHQKKQSLAFEIQ